MFENVTCPHCDAGPINVEDAERAAHLNVLGYLHRDIRLTCEEGHTWTHGVPEGRPATADLWTCDACDGAYTPRDVALGHDSTLQVVVKCRDCSYKPDVPIRFDIPAENTGNNEWRILLGHPDVCGDTTNAREHNARLTPT